MTGKASFQAIVRSINPNFYKEVAFQSFGRSLLYLLFLALIVNLLVSVRFVIEVKSGLNQIFQTALKRLPELMPQGIPEIHVEKGIVSSPVAQPMIAEKDNFAFVLDTTGKVTSLDSYKNGLLLTKDKLVIKAAKESDASTEIKEYDLSKMRINQLIIRPGDQQKNEIFNLTLDKRVFSVTESAIKKIAFWIVLILIPFFLVFGICGFFVAKLIQVLFFSLFALSANAIFQAKLKYRNLLNIGTYAISLPALASAVLILSTGQDKSLFFLPWWALYIVFYLFILIAAIKKTKVA